MPFALLLNINIFTNDGHPNIVCPSSDGRYLEICVICSLFTFSLCVCALLQTYKFIILIVVFFLNFQIQIRVHESQSYTTKQIIHIQIEVIQLMDGNGMLVPLMPFRYHPSISIVIFLCTHHKWCKQIPKCSWYTK